MHHATPAAPSITDAHFSPDDARALNAAVAARSCPRAPAMVVASFDATGVTAWHGEGDPRMDGSAVTRETVFRIASMTKSFLAATALALAEEGRLDLGADIRTYLPSVRLCIDGEAQAVTVGELLANRSGLPEDNAWGDRQLDAEREAVAAMCAAGIALTETPGVRYQYSNLGMSLVGRAIEAVSGKRIEAEIRDRFIDPLGLTGTRFTVDEYPHGTDIAHGFRSFDAGETFVPEPFIGSGALACIGGLFSTVDDVASWAWFLASGFADSPVRPDLLSARSRREMQRAHTPMAAPVATGDRDCASLAYALGLFVAEDRRFGRVADHSGGLPGFTSNMRWHVESGRGTVAFGNSDVFRADALATAAHARVLEFSDVPSTTVLPWPECVTAAERFDGLLRDGAPLTGAADISAANLLADFPDEARTSRFADLLAQAGGPVAQRSFAERTIGATDAGHLRWRIDCARGSLVCDLRMVGLTVPLVQSLQVSLAGPSGLKPEIEAPCMFDRAVLAPPRNASV
ncbi:serine hydrolase domain-containing protein [Leucobacter komagatae]|uniref:serine hydrolase domain-containing protein n=1 Tax=Leucobacter komagatae TaxID=55969 RepID=UPI000A041D1F|nr:serine hydrolase domain-containing protein [Leucobacter komagatae]